MYASVRVSYPEGGKYDWFEAVREFESIGFIEVAFYLPQLFLDKVKTDDVISPFKNLKIKAKSVHMAHAHITEPPIFESVLKKTIEIAKLLDCDTIVAHPSYGRLHQVELFIDNVVSPLLDENKIYLCWETFSGKRRFLSGLEGIADFCQKRKWHKACFDFSHIHGEQEKILNSINKYLELIRIFHLSNRISEKRLQHLPLFHEKTDLNFYRIIQFLKKKNIDGTVVLEYLPEYHSYLKNDAQFLMGEFIEKPQS